MAIWLALKTWFGGLPTWVIPALAGAAAVLSIVWGVYHAGEASARADAAERLARDNATNAQLQSEARTKAEIAFRDASADTLKARAELYSLKQEISRVAKGSASPGCARAIRGVLQRADHQAPAPTVPGKPKPGRRT